MDKDFLTVILQRESGRKSHISLIIKDFPDGDGKQQMVTDMGVFRREIQIFKTVLKEMENLLSETDIKSEKLWADLIGYRPYRTIIFEDLAATNYRVPPRKDCQDLNHAILTMVELARFHALSRVLIRRGILVKQDFPKYLMCDRNFCTKTGMPSLVRMGEILQESWGKEWEDLGKRLVNCPEKIINDLINDNENCDKKFYVLNHGDLWTCNMMFKYSVYEDKPIALKFVDYQLCHINSFAWDLTYYLYSSVEPDVRRKNNGTLLRRYADSLKSELVRFGVDEKEIPSFQEIYAEMERIKAFRVMIMCFLHPIMTYESDDAYDLDKSLSSEQTVAPKEECFLSERFKARVGADIRQFAENGII
ncbi:uncharacterized protein LOC106671001 isoform X2 [Cimex lectularius]|uniref:CHK kinase-like domain-containing protein n=1 Tax=Cimex lectularius TaxID=79782 RepID=A0A8I6SUT7_CIMLE|nr:uncharacterized protein LOC106671001 isoform X2 [Cimex lectularius]